MTTDIIDTDIKTSFAKGKNLIMYANDHPYKVTAVDSASITANDHPFKVLIEGGVVTPEQFAELEAKVDALATDLTFKGSVETYDDLPETADDGDTYLVTSTGILYTFVNNDPIPLNEGVNVVQTTGTSTTDVMSQNAVTSMVFADPATKRQVQIGSGANAAFSESVAVGRNSEAYGQGAVALGAYARAGVNGTVNIGSTNINYGYMISNYRLLTGLYDGQSAHDAATVGQLGETLTDTEFINILNGEES